MADVNKKACSRCRRLKIKCDRLLPSCSRCEDTRHACQYLGPKDSQLRIRDQTDVAARRAITGWRTRTLQKGLSSSDHIKPLNDRLARSVDLPIENLAFQRFLYDFADCHGSPFYWFLGYISRRWASKPASPKQAATKLALNAVSLANFNRRHHDQRAAQLAWTKHGAALSNLSHCLKDPTETASYETVLMALMLGLYQNIHQDHHFIGAWAQHYRGSINLLLPCKENSPEKVRLASLLAKQALNAGMRLDIPIHLPKEIQTCLEYEGAIERKTMQLGMKSANLSSSVRRGQFCSESEIYEQVMALEDEFDLLETELQSNFPIKRTRMAAESYPRWYWPISTHPGGPDTSITYPNSRASFFWDFYRGARIKLHTVVSGLEDLSYAESIQKTNTRGTPGGRVGEIEETSSLDPLPSCTRVRLSDDICASVFCEIMQNADGRPPRAGFDAIPGSTAYTLMTPLHIAHDSLKNKKPPEGAALSSARCSWIQNALKVLEEQTGVAEAWVISEKDWQEGASSTLQLLTFPE